jgi:hypothetical protein
MCIRDRANTNPIILNAAGRTPNEIWQTTGVLLKFILYNSLSELIGTYDGIPSINDPFGLNSQLSSIAGTNSITATASPTITAYATGAIYSFIAANTNTGASTLSIDGLTAASITKNGAVAISAGDIQAGKMMLVEYDGAAFQLVNNIIYGGSITNGNIVSLTAPMSAANGGTGLATLTANNVLLGNGIATVQLVAPGVSGNLLTSNGTTWASAAPAGVPTIQTFTTTGTFTVPAGVTRVKVTVVGGGGPGSSYGGGGGGGTAIKIVTGLTPAGTVAVTVGSSGGTSSFGAYCSATGGGASVSNAGGVGGAGSSGDVNLAGNGGSGGSVSVGFGAGGGSSLGGGGNGNVSAAGDVGRAYGGGAGGSGGAGASGVVIVEY